MWAVRVTGRPRPKGDMKCFGRGGRHRLSWAPSADEGRWRDLITHAGEQLAQSIPDAPLTCAVSMEITFTMPRPKTVPRSVRLWPIVKPDVDKLERMILDAFTGSVWADDAQVVEVTKRKAYPDSPAPDLTPGGGALIRVWRTET